MVRSYALRIVNAATEGDMAAVRALEVSEGSGNWNAFEVTVAHQLCADPELRSSSWVPHYTSPPSLERGDVAPDWRLPLVHGGGGSQPDSLSLRDLRGHYVIVNFWATWCIPCKDEYPLVAALQQEFGPRGLKVIGVLHQDAAAKAAVFEAEQPHTFESVVGDETVARAYLVHGIPKTIVIGPDGKILDIALGLMPGQALEAVRGRFDALLPKS